MLAPLSCEGCSEWQLWLWKQLRQVVASSSIAVPLPPPGQVEQPLAAP